MPNNEEKTSGWKKVLKWVGFNTDIDDDDLDDDDLDEEEEVEQQTKSYNQNRAGQQSQYNANPQFTAYQGGKTAGANNAETAQSANNRGGNPMQFSSNESKHDINIYQLNEHGQTKTVIDDLLVGKSVLINMQTLDAIESQRVIDTLSGAAYAIDAKIKPVAHQAYLIAPAGVKTGGNYAEEEAAAKAQAQQPSGGIGTGTISSNLYRRNAE